MKTIAVKDYMQHKKSGVNLGTPLPEVVDRLLKHNISGLPVLDENKKVVGFVSEKDCIAKLLLSSYYCEGTSKVEEVMFKEPLTVTTDDSIVELAEMMTKQKPKIYPVVDDGKYVGIITRADVLRALREHGDACQNWTGIG